MTQDLKKSVRAAHSACRECLEQENEEKEKKKKKEEARKRKEMSEMAQKEKDRLLEQKKSLAKSEEDLSEHEAQARQESEAADELLNDARLKLSEALACTHLNKNSVTVAQMMLETAEKKRKEAMGNLDNTRKKQKSLDKTTHKLLDQALPATGMVPKKRKGESVENPEKGSRVKQLAKTNIDRKNL